jgi:pilus assembly protein Flp/PilA
VPWLTALSSLLHSADWTIVDGWRRRRDHFLRRSRPTYDAYPSDDIPPEVRFYLEARDAKGRLLREYVHLEGYSIHHLNWKSGAMRGGVPVRDWFIGQMLEAMVRLMARVESTRSKGQGLAEYALMLALIAIIAITALIFLGGQVANVLSVVGNSIDAP